MADRKNGPEATADGATTEQATPKVNKKEAIRLAVATLGRDAEHAKLQEYIKERFGHYVPLKHIAAFLSTLSKEKEAPAPQPLAPPAEAREEAEGQEGEVVLRTRGGKPNRMDG